VKRAIPKNDSPSTSEARNFSSDGHVQDVESAVQDDAHLIRASLAGDSASFGRLVCRYQDRLYHTVVHVVGSREDALDLVQDAFVQAFLRLETFQGASAFYTWLYRIALNLSLSWKRKQRPTMSVDQARELSGAEPPDHHGARPEHAMDQEERAGQVRRALIQLSDEHRQVLVLREMEGASYETISEMLDVPLGTVRSRLHRARIELREQLRDVLQENN
jgi:RNA polymerase sigma-70 factor (ECF subfamily)